MQSSLGAGSPPFVLWRISELPEEWLEPATQRELAHAARSSCIPLRDLGCYAAVVLPDIGVGRLYYRWAVEQLERADADEDLLPVLLISQDERPYDNAAAFQQFVDAIRTEGKPPPHFCKVFGYYVRMAEDGR